MKKDFINFNDFIVATIQQHDEPNHYLNKYKKIKLECSSDQ